MSCCCSARDAEAKRINRDIERELRRQERDQRREIKLLLLGTGESGKSTFIKQMRIIHGAGYSENDRKKEYTRVVYRNVFMAVQNLIKGVELLGLRYASEEAAHAAPYLRQVDYMYVTALDEQDARAVAAVWRDAGVRAAFARRNEYQLGDCADYFLNDLKRISSVDFVPTLEDVLRSRSPTSGIAEYCFDLQASQIAREKVRFRIVDVRQTEHSGPIPDTPNYSFFVRWAGSDRSDASGSTPLRASPRSSFWSPCPSSTSG